MTGRRSLLALGAALGAALVALAALAGCAPAPDPIAPGHPVVLRLPSGWEAAPVPGSGDPAAGGAGADPVVYAARPADDGGAAGLTVSALPGRVSTIESGVSVAEAGRELLRPDYRGEPPVELEVPGADEARRVDYAYTCADSGGSCAGTAFVMLRDRDLYIVRVSRREGGGTAPGVADDLQETLALAQ
ncbi:hypothetical protein HDA32_004301 [Spinactinospora alkalitolerans]|uniref:Lipoprotein n=1 Tax=Spinactinospora alkalitolerans TaxID=687207 RepID=A0A852TZF3_9ACTN|nr:hypothetical protein [Spinactinospora alkalitolerans]NYE49181.1 hypothetical protein [Spinactinospora alkalitolerans]